MTTARQFPVNYGVSRPFPTRPVPGGFEVTQNVQLISERLVRPMQWVITLAPITLLRAVGVVPWANTVDGQVNALPVPPQLGNIPSAALVSTPFQVSLSFGAGGLRNMAVFDYPVAGGTFGVTADALDLSVINPNPLAVPPVLPSLDDVPVFGAMMVPGRPSGPSTMRLTDLITGAAVAPGDFVQWSVKPYARRVWVSQWDQTIPNATFTVQFNDPAGQELWVSFDALESNRVMSPIPVPSGAAFMTCRVLAAAPGVLLRPMWEIELS